MNDVTLTVPAEYVQHFKLGVLKEIEIDCGHLVANAQEMSEKAAEWSDGDCQSTGRSLACDLAVLAQVAALDAGQDGQITVEQSGQEVFEHVLASTARVLAPRLTECLDYAPVGEEEASEVEGLAGAISWAATASERAARERVAYQAEVA